MIYLVVNGSHESARGAGPVCPLGVLRCLGALGWVVPEDQHDAHELLHVLFSCIDEENQAASKRVISENYFNFGRVICVCIIAI